ncbi:MAG: ComEC/Rec2 family competence protein [Pyrinomonadaceae bacterium]
MAESISPKRFSNFPLLWLAICFAAGAFAAQNFPIRLELLVAICLSSAIAASFFARREFASVFVAMAFMAAGSMTYSLHQGGVSADRLKRIYDEQQIASGEPVEIVGTLVGNREAAFDGFFITLNTERLYYKGSERVVSGRLRLFAPIQSAEMAADYAEIDLRSGSTIRVACNPVREENYQNPGVLSRKELLDWQDLDATATLKSPLLVEKIRNASSWNPTDAIYSSRQYLIDKFREKFSVSTAGIMIASLLGNKHFLDKSSAEVFREGGTFHILVISGLHITFIGGLLLLLVRIFARNKVTQFVVVSSILWIYTIAVGAEVPVVRASLMFTILLFSHVIYRTSSLVNSLGACALILLVWRPQDLFGPSFQLTFVSVAAIVVMGFPLIEKLRSIGSWTPTIEAPFPPFVPNWLKRLCETIYWREDAWRIEAKRHVWSANLFKSPYRRLTGLEAVQNIAAFIFEGVLISIIVQLWLLPFLVVYFHRVSILSVLLNLWAGVFIALESFAALIAISFSLISNELAFPFIKLTELFNWLLIAFPGVFVQNNWASFRLPIYTGWPGSIYAIYLLPVIVLGYAIYNWNPFAMPGERMQYRLNLRTIYSIIALAVLLGIVIIFHPFTAPRPDGRLHIDFLDVGQADAALITFPDGKTMLVDGGGRVNYKRSDNDDESEIFEPDVPSIGESVVSEFLWEKGYSKIDHILATHADADHIQGLVDVAKNFQIGSAIFGRMPMNDSDFAELYEVMQRRGIVTETINRGEILKFGDVAVEVLYPFVSNDENAPSDNNNSVVLRLVYGSRAILLTGDIERAAETALVTNGGTLAADVVKVAHHGSRTSSTSAFIDATRAQYAIISVGRRSPFGHPHTEVVERWQATGAQVLTTGSSGLISISTDGKDLKIDKFH